MDRRVFWSWFSAVVVVIKMVAELGFLVAGRIDFAVQWLRCTGPILILVGGLAGAQKLGLLARVLGLGDIVHATNTNTATGAHRSARRRGAKR